MKGLVVETKNNKSVLLSDSGEFIKADGLYEVGETVDLSEIMRAAESAGAGAGHKTGRRVHFGRKLIAACAALVILLGAGAAYAASTPFSYVTLDAAASIEYEVNFFNRVIDASALNGQAASVVRDVRDRVDGETVTEAVRLTIDDMKESGQIGKSSDRYAIVSVVSKIGGRADRLSSAIKENVGSGGSAEMTVSVFEGTMEDRRTARTLDISTGRLQAAKHITGKSNSQIRKDPASAEQIAEVGSRHVRKLLKGVDSNRKKTDGGGSAVNGNASREKGGSTQDSTRQQSGSGAADNYTKQKNRSDNTDTEKARDGQTAPDTQNELENSINRGSDSLDKQNSGADKRERSVNGSGGTVKSVEKTVEDTGKAGGGNAGASVKPQDGGCPYTTDSRAVR